MIGAGKIEKMTAAIFDLPPDRQNGEGQAMKGCLK
jgi:hypothetical protein